MVSRCPVFVVLLLAAAVAVNAADSKYASPMFSLWKAQQGSSKAKAAGGYYEEVETEKVCLDAASMRNCRPLAIIPGETPTEPELQGVYLESTLSCCGEKPNKSFLGEGAPVNAVCSWKWYFFVAAFGGQANYPGTDLVKIGFFDVTCEMKEDADKCGSPLCHGMNIIGTGDILAYPNVSFIGKESLELPIIGNETFCQAFFGPFGPSADRKLRTVATKASSTKPAPKAASDKPAAGKDAPSKDAAKTQAKIQYGYEYGPTFYTGAGWILSGTFQTLSVHKPTKADKGLIQLVIPVSLNPGTDFLDNFVESDYPPEKAYVADGYQVHMSFINNKGYEKY